MFSISKLQNEITSWLMLYWSDFCIFRSTKLRRGVQKEKHRGSVFMESTFPIRNIVSSICKSKNAEICQLSMPKQSQPHTCTLTFTHSLISENLKQP
jgi:hypothetical protein